VFSLIAIETFKYFHLSCIITRFSNYFSSRIVKVNLQKNRDWVKKGLRIFNEMRCSFTSLSLNVETMSRRRSAHNKFARRESDQENSFEPAAVTFCGALPGARHGDRQCKVAEPKSRFKNANSTS
jgi:hypothetical protein